MTLHAERLSHVYLSGTPLQRPALTDVSLSVEAGECVAVVGISGSGKSTLARILAGLTPPSAGHVWLDGEEITAIPLVGGWGRRLRALRRAVRRGAGEGLSRLRHARRQEAAGAQAAPKSGNSRPVMLAFQNPEDQFFTASVFEEVGIGLVAPAAAVRRRQLTGLRATLAELRARRARSGVERDAAIVSTPRTPAGPSAAVLQALRLVELSPDVYGRRDPFTLSGGEQRRLALAVLLARSPRVLILDEPSAGLDDPGRARLYACIERVRAEQNTAVLLVSHDLEEVAAVAGRVIVLHAGRISVQGPVATVLHDGSLLAEAGLMPPPLVCLRDALAQRGFVLNGDWRDVDGAAAALLPALPIAAKRAAGHA